MEPVDVSGLFPDYDRAEAVEVANQTERVEVRLWSGGTYATLVLGVDAMYDKLNAIRQAQGAGAGTWSDRRVGDRVDD